MKKAEIYSFESHHDGPPLTLDWFMETSGLLMGEVLPDDLETQPGAKSTRRIKGNMFEAADVFQWRDYMLELASRRAGRIAELEAERVSLRRDEMSDAAYRFMISSMADAREMTLRRVEEFVEAFQATRVEMDAAPLESRESGCHARMH